MKEKTHEDKDIKNNSRQKIEQNKKTRTKVKVTTTAMQKRIKRKKN